MDIAAKRFVCSMNVIKWLGLMNCCLSLLLLGQWPLRNDDGFLHKWTRERSVME